MPVYIKPVTLQVLDISRYGGANPTHGSCDKCGRDGSLDATLVMSLQDQAVMMHYCGHCGTRTEVMKFVIQELACKPITIQDTTLLASRMLEAEL